MAMRVRNVNGHVIAVCAAEYPAMPGDLYIDDAQDHAIRVKLRADWQSEGYMFRPSSAFGISALEAQVELNHAAVPSSGTAQEGDE